MRGRDKLRQPQRQREQAQTRQPQPESIVERALAALMPATQTQARDDKQQR